MSRSTRKFGVQPLIKLLFTPLACLALAVHVFAETPVDPDPAVDESPLREKRLLEEQRTECEEIWRKGKVIVLEKIEKLEADIPEGSDNLIRRRLERLQELQEELAGIEASLDYCEATYSTSRSYIGLDSGFPSNMSLTMGRPFSQGTGGKLYSGFQHLFVSTPCGPCRKMAKDFNVWTLVQIKNFLIRDMLWGDTPAPGETQNETAQRSQERVRNFETFKKKWQVRWDEIQDCNKRMCPEPRDKAAGSGTGAVAGSAVTGGISGDERSSGSSDADAKACKDPACTRLMTQIRLKRSELRGIERSLTEQEQRYQKAHNDYVNCKDCDAEKLEQMEKYVEIEKGRRIKLEDRQLKLRSEITELENELEKCKAKHCVKKKGKEVGQATTPGVRGFVEGAYAVRNSDDTDINTKGGAQGAMGDGFATTISTDNDTDGWNLRGGLAWSPNGEFSGAGNMLMTVSAEYSNFNSMPGGFVAWQPGVTLDSRGEKDEESWGIAAGFEYFLCDDFSLSGDLGYSWYEQEDTGRIVRTETGEVLNTFRNRRTDGTGTVGIGATYYFGDRFYTRVRYKYDLEEVGSSGEAESSVITWGIGAIF